MERSWELLQRFGKGVQEAESPESMVRGGRAG